MGNAIRLIASCVCGSQDAPHHGHGWNWNPQEAGHAAFARDLLHFETTGQVPEGLASHVKATRATQIIWYKKLLNAWKKSDPPPSSAPEIADFILTTLQTRRTSDGEGFLKYYGLSRSEVAPGYVQPPSTGALYPTWPKGVQYEFTTLPVENHDVSDGDTVTVFVDVNTDKRESRAVPEAISQAISKRRHARDRHDYATADALQKEILLAGFKVFDAKNGHGEVICHKYRIRLRGVDAPEKAMPHGSESREELSRLVEGHQLRVYVYTADQYGRLVADLHTKNGFVQETLLKKGCVWHYTSYDHRPEFTQWEQQARKARLGLWRASNPQKPWEYRKNKK